MRQGCLEQRCDADVQAQEWFVLESTDGPIEHVALLCAHGHRFTVPLDYLPRYRAHRLSQP